MLPPLHHRLPLWVGLSGMLMLGGCKDAISENQKVINRLHHENEELTKTANEMARRVEYLTDDRSLLLRSVGDSSAHEAKKQAFQQEIATLSSSAEAAEKQSQELAALVDKLRKNYLYQ